MDVTLEFNQAAFIHNVTEEDIRFAFEPQPSHEVAKVPLLIRQDMKGVLMKKNPITSI